MNLNVYNQKLIHSNIICPKCGTIYPALQAKPPKRGFLSPIKIYCPTCKKEVKGRDVREIDFAIKYLSAHMIILNRTEKRILDYLKQHQFEQRVDSNEYKKELKLR